ncbi:MAG: NAD(P)-dependent oxidoreductase, partial [Planctomycetes bacterium]|nr:NAD(P)-dependent oxidoreductase [Planctomycetota bacterium]
AFVLECLFRLFGSKKPPLVTRYSTWLIGRRCFFETHKAREQLGWQSTITYDEGIPAAVAQYLAHIGEQPLASSSTPSDSEAVTAGTS